MLSVWRCFAATADYLSLSHGTHSLDRTEQTLTTCPLPVYFRKYAPFNMLDKKINEIFPN